MGSYGIKVKNEQRHLCYYFSSMARLRKLEPRWELAVTAGGYLLHHLVHVL